MKKTEIYKEELFSLLNGKISMLINRYLQNRLKAANIHITVEQWTVLACLWKKDKITQQALSDITYRDKTSMTRLIDNIEKNGLVVRVPDTSDRRANLIFLTQKGTDTVRQATNIIDEAVDETLKQIPDEAIETCRDVLNKILRNIT